ncbi:hypothetical protein COY95_02525 [Candidatus Woesearchaeota archaeon CG_4_10_14_0_8_um_filter_47_5]|nr:MAG: hypothetical protein COY95_02525 [Candidatus Woesearchaeota archaeon CG_4_10_14_0_8_um_filter_47_5]
MYEKSAAELGLSRVCVLDSNAEKTLAPEDCNLFGYLVFGGILGDNPPKRRTLPLIQHMERMTKGERIETRNLGDRQMPTDTAVYVAHRILEGRKLSEFRFAEELEIVISDESGVQESVTLPFRYVIEEGKPVLAEGLVEYIKENPF